MIRPEVLDALVAAGCTSEQIAAAVKADMRVDEAGAIARREKTAERQRRHRDRNALSRDVTVTQRDETSSKKVSPDTPFEENQSLLKTPLKGVKKVSPSDELSEALGVFNATAEKLGWPQASKLTSGRSSALRQRLAESGGLPGWRAAIERAGRSPFLRGETGRSPGHEAWRPDFDWLVKAQNFAKLIEGSYDGRKASGPLALVREEPAWDARAKYFQRYGWMEIWGDERDIPPEHRHKFVRLQDQQHQGAA